VTPFRHNQKDLVPSGAIIEASFAHLLGSPIRCPSIGQRGLRSKRRARWEIRYNRRYRKRAISRRWLGEASTAQLSG
jgi:hypothetical protein